MVQSNSLRQVAAAAAKLGLACHLAVYHGRVEPPSKAYGRSGNALLNRLYGAELHEVPWTGDRNAAIHTLADELSQQGQKPYVVPYGVSCPLGAVGYASIAVELADQCAALGIRPSAVVHSSGSGATQAGLVVGATALLPGVQVVGIDIDAEPERVRTDVVAYAAAAAELLGCAFAQESVEVVAGHAGPAYGVPHDATLEAIRLAGRLEAMELDPVYSGKGLAGLLALMRAGRWSSGEEVIFIHTGGAPALFAYSDILQL